MVYASGAAQAAAQWMLDQHVTVSATGLCRICMVPGPCEPWESAAAVFTRSGRLLRRTPGLSRPELIGARQVRVHRTPNPTPVTRPISTEIRCVLQR
jgi:hypothetical protein